MIEISIPGNKDLRIEHLVLDYNGTIACDGQLLDGVREALTALSANLTIHIVTADTFSKAKEQLGDLPVTLTILPLTGQAQAKMDYVKAIGSYHAAAVGNGLNDELMLKEAALGIALIQEEGAAAATLQAADVVCANIRSALRLLTMQNRLIATLRA